MIANECMPLGCCVGQHRYGQALDIDMAAGESPTWLFPQ